LLQALYELSLPFFHQKIPHHNENKYDDKFLLHVRNGKPGELFPADGFVSLSAKAK
jgi:hypothetical protein